MVELGRARHHSKGADFNDAVRLHDVETLEDEMGTMGEGAFEVLTGLPMNRTVGS